MMWVKRDPLWGLHLLLFPKLCIVDLIGNQWSGCLVYVLKFTICEVAEEKGYLRSTDTRYRHDMIQICLYVIMQYNWIQVFRDYII